MKDYIDDILKGTAMEEVQIIKTTSKPQPTSTTIPKKTEKVTPKKIPAKSIRVPKEFTDALIVLFDGGKLTLIMDEVICDYLNRNRAVLEEKYRAKNPFDQKSN